MMARSDFYTVLAYMDVQTILTNIVYQKMLKLSSAAKIKYSAGEAVNLVFTDVERISSFWYNLLDFVYSPIMIIVCLVALFFVIGINVFYGIAVIVAFVPINAVLVKLANDFEVCLLPIIFDL
uniref:ABC transmembrane type-1 domain-containing protein n=1 Tax=Panagrolaimus superbus TaxID=310955 RepID=A0A914XXJ9_9BILA